MKKLTIFFVIAFLSLPFFASSQEASRNGILDNWSINVNGGSSLFWGDLRQYDYYPVYNYENERKIAFGFMLTKKLSSAFELRGQLIRGDLAGTRRIKASYFNGEFNEYNVNLTLNFSRLIYGDNPCRRLNLYGIAGIGFIDFRSLKKGLGSETFINSRGYSSQGTVKEKMQTESILLTGFGLKYRLDKRFELNLENIWTGVNSDDIDATREGHKYDILTYTSLGLTFKFNLRKNPSAFVDCGDRVKSKDKKATLGEPDYVEDPAVKAEREAMAEKIKALETRVDNQDAKIKELEIQVKALPSDVNVDALRESIYKSIMDTLKRNPINMTMTSGYLQFSVFFDVNKFNIKEEENTKIAAIAEHLKNNKNLKLKITGNCDQTGSIEYNLYLSNKRAEQVYNVLVNKYGIEKNRLSLEGKGKNDPFSGNYYSVNRRVDFIEQ